MADAIAVCDIRLDDASFGVESSDFIGLHSLVAIGNDVQLMVRLKATQELNRYIQESNIWPVVAIHSDALSDSAGPNRAMECEPAIKNTTSASSGTGSHPSQSTSLCTRRCISDNRSVIQARISGVTINPKKAGSKWLLTANSMAKVPMKSQI